MLEWESDRLFADDAVNKVQTRKNRMYYQYGEWTEVKMSYDKPQVISVFFCVGVKNLRD